MDLKVAIGANQSLAHLLGLMIEEASESLERARRNTEDILQSASKDLLSPHVVSMRLTMDMREILGRLDSFTCTARDVAESEEKQEKAKRPPPQHGAVTTKDSKPKSTTVSEQDSVAQHD